MNLADHDELLEQMRTAGFRRLFIGIETPVPESSRSFRLEDSPGPSYKVVVLIGKKNPKKG